MSKQIQWKRISHNYYLGAVRKEDGLTFEIRPVHGNKWRLRQGFRHYGVHSVHDSIAKAKGYATLQLKEGEGDE